MYTTKVINIAGEDEGQVHFMVRPVQTLCGIKLNEKQILLKYSLDDEEKICEKCREKSPVPRLKDWCPRYKIKNGDHAKTALLILYLYFQSLDEQVQLGWGIHEYAYYRICRTTNVLVNPHPIIIFVKEEEKVLKVSLIGGDGRVEEEIPFHLIEEFMPLVREDYLEHLQERTN